MFDSVGVTLSHLANPAVQQKRSHVIVLKIYFENLCPNHKTKSRWVGASYSAEAHSWRAKHDSLPQDYTVCPEWLTSAHTAGGVTQDWCLSGQQRASVRLYFL